MREPNYRSGMSVTRVMIIILVAVFALQCINDVYIHSGAESWLALTYEGFGRGWAWQLLTFQLLHHNLAHIFMNLITFWWAGEFVEGVLGKKRFLIALFGCGLVGGLLQGSLMLMFPEHYGYMTVGASAGVAGLVAIFGLLQRDQEIRLNLILPIRAIWLVWILGGISLFFTLVPTPREMAVAHAAHLGGILAGLAWVKLGWHHDFNQLPWEGWVERLKSRRPPSEIRPGSRASVARRPERAATVLDSGELSSDEVDVILDKINAQGMKSLTAHEREILESARKKMTKS